MARVFGSVTKHAFSHINFQRICSQLKKQANKREIWRRLEHEQGVEFGAKPTGIGAQPGELCSPHQGWVSAEVLHKLNL